MIRNSNTISCIIDDFSSEILELDNVDSTGDLYATSVRSVLKYISVDYRSRDKINLFDNFTHEAFAFFLHRSPAPDNRKIEIFSTTFKSNPSITILIVIENRLFVIDLLNSLMLKLDLQAIFTFHLAISTIRDDNGNLQKIVDKGKSKINKSLVYIKTLSAIKVNINNIIDLVDYIYNAWHTLLNKVISVTMDIVHNKSLYKKEYFPAEETLDFLNCLQKNNIIFLGVVDFNIKFRSLINEEGEGVKNIWQSNFEEISTIIEFSKSEYYENKLVTLGKINKLSPMHRNALVDYILIKRLDEDRVYGSGTIVFGLYGTLIYFQSTRSVPVLRGKMNYVLEESGLPSNGYNTKRIKNIIELMKKIYTVRVWQ